MEVMDRETSLAMDMVTITAAARVTGLKAMAAGREDSMYTTAGLEVRVGVKGTHPTSTNPTDPRYVHRQQCGN